MWDFGRIPNNPPLSPRYQLLGNPAPPCADRGCTDSCSTEGKAHWHNILRGSAKPPTSTGESILLEIYRERITIYMEEEDHFTQTQLPALFGALTAAAIAALSFSPLSCTHSRSLSPFALSRMPINRQVWWLLFFNNSSCTWVDTFVNGRCNYHWQMVTLLLRVGCPIMANPNIGSTITFCWDIAIIGQQHVQPTLRKEGCHCQW
jgi:hypothetical protein